MHAGLTKQQRKRAQYSAARLEAADARLDSEDSDGCSEGHGAGGRIAVLQHAILYSCV